MTEEQQFAAVLAQVIPVVVLAIVVEARHHHNLRIDPQGGAAQGGNDFGLYVQIGTLTIMTFLEVAALLTVRGNNAPAWITWFAGFPGVVAVGLLMMAMAQIYIESLADAYDTQLKDHDRVQLVSRCVLGAAILFGVAGVISVSVAG
ncbi:hypothetical protein [Streptomyces europaeiscabiei]|uniref:hypothetical protein n=1 Tax=Streptomyces europaeiscabiei TaxID=146819 RepID=UPI0038F66280